MSGSKEEKIAKHIKNGRLHRTPCEKNGSDHMCLFCVVVFISLKIYVVKTVTQCTVLVCGNVSIEYIIDNHCSCIKLVVL